MQVQLATICDAATEHMGKLNILGAFDAIMARQFPLVHPMCFIAVRFILERFEEGQHRVKLKIVDEDGQNLIDPAEMQMTVQFPPHLDRPFVSQNLVMTLQRLKFEKPGRYDVQVLVDGKFMSEIPLSIMEPPANMPPQGGPSV